jgi:oligosaccharyltransferase complex subunit beta
VGLRCILSLINVLLLFAVAFCAQNARVSAARARRCHVAEFAGLQADELVKFVDLGGNIFVVGAPDISASIRSLGLAFGVDFDAPKARVVDHFSFHAQSDTGKHTRVLSSAYFPSAHLVGEQLSKGGAAPVFFDGIGMSISPDNILAVKTLTASPTGYSAVPGEPIQGYPQSIGNDTVLVAAVQARNNARATFVGSLWALSDEAFSMAGNANTEFARSISTWTTQERGVLRAKHLRHRHQDGSPAEKQVGDQVKPDLPLSMFPQPEIARNSLVYRIHDDIEFAVDIEQYDNQKWVPYVAHDVQLEFVMLDPYIRQNLNVTPAGEYIARFRVPDTYGIYNFRVQYRRPGLTVISLKEQVSVRPFRHDEYERFIVSAYPYYTAAFAMMAGVFVFSFLFLFSPSVPAIPAAASKKNQ